MEQRTSDQTNKPETTPVEAVKRASKAPKKKWDVEPKVIHDLSNLLIAPDFASPYDVTDLEVGSGLFIVTEPNQSMEELMDKVNSEVLRLNEYWSVPAHNDRGEEILDQVTVKEYKRNNDGSIQRSGDDRLLEGASFDHILRRVQIRQYVAKSVTADVDNDQIDDDGALIVRVF